MIGFGRLVKLDGSLGIVVGVAVNGPKLIGQCPQVSGEVLIGGDRIRPDRIAPDRRKLDRPQNRAERWAIDKGDIGVPLVGSRCGAAIVEVEDFRVFS